MEWIKLATRPLAEEEIAEGYEYDFMWNCLTPEIDEEVLVSDGETVWTDTWVDYGSGVGWENLDNEEGYYWMPFPKPPKRGDE